MQFRVWREIDLQSMLLNLVNFVVISYFGHLKFKGDSGGPLTGVVGGQRRVLGVTSFGSQSCAVGYPQAFTRVTFYLSWISSKCGIPVGP
jgi:secreted trypsin-like serine protease